MPAQSKSQQRFFGVVKAMQKGDIPKKGKAGKIAKTMDKDDVDDFASTKHKGKPEKVKKEQRVKNLIKKMVREEMNEAIGKGMFWKDLKSGTSIEFTGGTTYVVTKIDKNKLQMSLKRRGKTGGGLFAPKAKLDKSQFESQVKVGLIKYLINTNPRIKEGKLTEGWKPIVKKKVKYKDKEGGTYTWEIESGIDTDVMGGNTPKIILFYQHKDKEGYPESGGNTFWLKHKNGKPYTPQEAKKLVNKIANKKIMDFQRKSNNPSGSGQNVYYQDGKFIREGKLTEKSAISLNLWIKEFERLAKKNRMKPVDFIKKHISKRKGMDNEVVKNVLKHFQKNEGKLTEDYKNSEWEVYLKDEKGREKIVKKAKSKRAATILYNKIIKSDDYYEVGMRAIKEGKLTESQQVAKTILQQLGGNRFIAMTGAKNFGSSKNSLQFKIGRNSKSISHVIITLKSSDLYDVEFIRMRGTSRKVVKKVTGVYADMLGKIFTKYTGMNVRL